LEQKEEIDNELENLRKNGPKYSKEKLEKETARIKELCEKFNSLREAWRKLEKEIQVEKLTVKDYTGKEVIKAEISQELIEAKEIFANFQISETTQEEIKSKISKHIDNIKNTWDGGNYFANTLSFVPIVGNVVGPIHASEHSEKLEKHIKKEAKETLPAVVNKLITKATADLEKQKKKVLKKMDTLMEARGKEVREAKKVIEALEIVNRERENEIKDLREKSDREINKLQESIKKLNEQLKDYREKEANFQKFLNKQREEKTKKIMDNIDKPIQDDQAKIKALQDLINTLEASLDLAEKSRDQRAKELQHEKENHATTKANAEKDLEAKENELARKMKIADDLQKKLNQEIRDWEAKHKKVSDEKHELDLENVDLKAENKKFKDKYNKAKVEAEEWKTKWEGLQPT
jgi:hypothetical protein